MKKNILFFVIAVISMLNVACNNQDEKISNSLNIFFNELNKETKVDCSTRNDTVFIKIELKSFNIFDIDGIKLFTSYLISENRNLFNKDFSIFVDYDFSPILQKQILNDISSNNTVSLHNNYFENNSFAIFIDKKSIASINEKINPKFSEFIKYTITNFDVNDYFYCQYAIGAMNFAFPNKFTFNGTFLLFLYNLSVSYKDLNDKNTIEFVNFCSASYHKSSHIPTKHLDFFLKSIGLDPNKIKVSKPGFYD